MLEARFKADGNAPRPVIPLASSDHLPREIPGSRRADLERAVRASVSRELHDRVSHRLAVAMQQVQMVQLGLGNSDEVLGRLLATLGGALEDVRDVAVGLRQQSPPSFLSDSIRESLGPPTPGAIVSVRTFGHQRTLPSAVAEDVLMIVLEAVRNAQKHSAGTVITVSVSWSHGRLITVIEDDGRGFNRAHVGERSLGLRTMRERSEVVGGVLRIESSSAGTKVVLSVPTER